MDNFSEKVDFALASWSVHEVPDINKLFQEVGCILKPGAKFMVIEPKGHVSQRQLDDYAKLAEPAGFKRAGSVKVFYSRSLVLEKKQ
jgi:ubiquinone/menaquinone biosynthesis C-methylase UbiE